MPNSNATHPTFDPLSMGEQMAQFWRSWFGQTAALPPVQNYWSMFRPPLPPQTDAAWQDASSQWREIQKNFYPDAIAPQLQFDEARVKDLPEQYATDLKQLVANFQQNQLPAQTDRRFNSEAWQKQPYNQFLAALYQLNVRYSKQYLQGFEQSQAGDRLRFDAEQWLEAMAPSNFFATNPEAMQTLIDSNGASLFAGLKNLLSDLQKGSISLTDDSQFEVGKNLAITPGKVIFENELMQLIQYTPVTPQVKQTPILLVPPCINKYYILDLQPHNSLVNFLVQNGIQVFLVSWRNPGPEQAHLTWDDYIESGVLQALSVTRDFNQGQAVNALGFCIGGTLLGNALAVAAARGEQPVKNLTLLTTFLDFTHTGQLGMFVTEGLVQMRENTIGGTPPGILSGKELASSFSMLRPNDLIWSYVVNNYLKGQSPLPLDLLFWNGDTTNMAGPMYAWYLRHTYLENNLKRKGAVKVCGESFDFSKITADTFVYASIDDHIVPWTSAYATRQLLGGKTEFVLGASGHIAGVINPVSKNKRNYWINTSAQRDSSDPQQWQLAAESKPGSWWGHWLPWLQARSGADVAAPLTHGNQRYAVIEEAPGRYVQAVVKLSD